MTDAFEDRLRRHLAERAARVPAVADPDGLIQRATGGRRRRAAVATGAVAVLVVAGAGVAGGAALASGGASPAPSHPDAQAPDGPASGSSTGPGRAGADVPAPAGPETLTLLFTRTTPSGVTIRAYTEGGSVPDPAPCPSGAMCARPMIAVPPGTTASCGGLVIEMSTERAVGTATAARTTTTADPDGVDVLGTGSFGGAEGDPVSWIVVQAGADVTSVQLTGAGADDAMAPTGGVAVLARSGAMDGSDVVGLGATGSTLSTVPAGPTAGGTGCAPAPAPVPTTTTTTTVPPSSPTTTTPTSSTTAPAGGRGPTGSPVPSAGPLSPGDRAAPRSPPPAQGEGVPVVW